MSVNEKVQTHGYALLPSFMPSISTLEAAAALGAIEQVDGLRLVQELTPKRLEVSRPNTYSGNFGRGEFPLHTDLAHWSAPPRYLMLRCVVGSSTVSTRITDGDVLIQTVGAVELGRCLVQPRRPLGGSLHLLPLLEHRPFGHRSVLRWDSLYLQPANPFGTTVCEKVASWISSVAPTEHILLNRGDSLIIDNWRMLHGRSSALHPASAREIHRIYLSTIL
jgi:L-asparagine oxygenase